MSGSARFVVISRSAAIGAAVIGLGYGAYQYAVRFGNLDPFRSLKRTTDPLGLNVGVRLADVRVHGYRNGKLVASMHADQVVVPQDHSTFDLMHIKNGLYYGDGKGVTHFATTKLTWNTDAQQLRMSGGARIQGKDFDIQTAGANLDRQEGTLRVPTPLAGRLYGGKLVAASLTYNMKTGDSRAGRFHWQGKPPASLTQGVEDQITPRTWNLGGEEVNRHQGIDICKDGHATDGEVLLLAPHIERVVQTDVLTATGRVSYFSGKVDVVADQVVVYHKEKRAVFTGNVLMLVKPKKDQDKPPAEEKVPEVKTPADVTANENPISPEEKKRDEDLRSGKTMREYPMNIKAEQITYWYSKGQRHAIIEGNPVANQEFNDGRWRHGDAHDAYYDGELDTLQLNSRSGHRDAHLKNSIGDHWEASMLKFSTKEDETEDNEDVVGKFVSGTYVDTSGEDTREPKKAPTPPTGPAPTPGTAGSPPPPATTGGGTQGTTTGKGGG